MIPRHKGIGFCWLCNEKTIGRYHCKPICITCKRKVKFHIHKFNLYNKEESD